MKSRPAVRDAGVGKARPRRAPFCVGTYVSFLFVACDFGGDRSLGSVSARHLADTVAVARAGAAGIDVDATGDAGASSVITTTLDATSCDPTASPNGCALGQFCGSGFDCGAAPSSLPFTCRERPTTCPVPSGHDVVCGCDGQYYESQCLAASAGVSMAHFGRCNPVPCLADSDCDRFTESCATLYGPSLEGALCEVSSCICGVTITLL